MTQGAKRVLLSLGRLISLVVLAVLGASAMVYVAPGYFADSREMDAAYASGARVTLERMQGEQHSLAALLGLEIRGWAHGDLGSSRQYDVPVSSLLRERARRSAVLLSEGVFLGWLSALLFAFPFSLAQSAVAKTVLPSLTAILLAVPVGVLAVYCLLSGHGGPVLVLATIVAARDCKLLYRILRDSWTAPFVLHARTQGLQTFAIARVHLLPVLRREVFHVGLFSFTMALSALVPVEVVFDGGGLGQLAWSAAMNRDLPVLVAVTGLMSACVGLAGALLGSRQEGVAKCA